MFIVYICERKCVILTVVNERVNKNQQNFRIFCAIWLIFLNSAQNHKFCDGWPILRKILRAQNRGIL